MPISYIFGSYTYLYLSDANLFELMAILTEEYDTQRDLSLTYFLLQRMAALA